MPYGKEQGVVMFKQEILMMPAGDSGAGGGGKSIEPQVLEIEVDGQKVRAAVEPSGDNNEAKFTLPDGVPEGAGDEYIAKVSKALQNTYKKNQETASLLKQQKADLEKQQGDSGNSKELQAKLDRLEAKLEGVFIGQGRNDNRGNENRNSNSDVFDPDAELLKAAGVDSWDDFDDLSPAKIARAQAKVQKMQYDAMNKKTQETQKQYEERVLLSNVSAKGYTPDEFKSWATAYGVPISEKSIELFLQLKTTTKTTEKQDEIDRANSINRIKQTIPSTGIEDGAIPQYTFQSPEDKQYKDHVKGIKDAIDKNSGGNVLARLGHR